MFISYQKEQLIKNSILVGKREKTDSIVSSKVNYRYSYFMPTNERIKPGFQNLVIDNLKRMVENRHSNLLKTINTGVISLFWDIGMVINSELKENDHVDGGQNFINEVSDYLQPIFGSYLNTEQLSLMKVFADNCAFSTMKHVSGAINWEYIPSFLNLKDDNAWIFYIELMHIESLTLKELNKKISAGIFEAGGKKLNTDKYTFMLSNSKPFYQNTLELYFGKKDGGIFRKLFEPQEDHHLNFDTVYHGSIINIYRKILDFQSAYNHALNAQFNSLFWEIGTEIIRLSNMFHIPLTNNVIDYCTIKLNKSFPSIFNKAELSNCLKLVKKYGEYNQPIELTQTVSWPYLKLLLEIDKVEKQFFVANQLLENGITVEELKRMISQGSFDFGDGRNLPSKETAINKSIITKKIKYRNNILSVTTETIEPNINPKHDLNRNIFKNPELLAFLMETNIYKD